jgi:hypothetical protein
LIRYSFTLLAFLLIFSCTREIIKEEITGDKITVFVKTESILHTEEMDSNELEAFLVDLGYERASKLILSEYIITSKISSENYRYVNLKSCLKDARISNLEENSDLISCAVSFRMHNCDSIISDLFNLNR